MRRDFSEKSIKMASEKDATYDQVPIVARSRSYQQPVSEAMEQTAEALRKCRHGRKKMDSKGY